MTGDKASMGILFRADMVRAIQAHLDPDPEMRALAKTVTRRASGLEDVNTYPGRLEGDSALGPLGYRGLAPTDHYIRDKAGYRRNPAAWHWFLGEGTGAGGRELNPIPVRCRWYAGQRLWVRETWRSVGWRPENGHWIEYRAGGRAWCEAPEDVLSIDVSDPAYPDRWRPSLLMPRWASRLGLQVTGVRAERLSAITAEDVIREGFGHAKLGTTRADFFGAYRAMYGLAPDADPFVWVVSFEVVAEAALATIREAMKDPACWKTVE